jgi:hypothetical protein
MEQPKMAKTETDRIEYKGICMPNPDTFQLKKHPLETPLKNTQKSTQKGTQKSIQKTLTIIREKP